MQLSKIKMSGFKSFVDPTTINLPSKLVAVVGPNGCGKSNIIDAVTWVMGESSPKYLRGEASTDVIFNGSTVRKPIGQASVELVFDNSDGTLGGEFSKFNEISIKRQINRDSDSTYFLNGVRCRKKDVVSLFLGTGLGPRSYSIIGQNMISKIIDAKPEELRTYLEEAAGVSKYKDRRHETELRMQHTKENLSRVNDLRGELEKQLSSLKQQANTAEKYKGLKQQERLFKAEFYAINWRNYDSMMISHSLKIQSDETSLEAKKSELTKIDREVEHLRHEQRVTQDAYGEIQRRYYSVGNEITRIEQDILHHQERQQQWETDFNKTESDWQTIKNQLADAEDNLHELQRELESLNPEFNKVNSDAKQLQTRYTDAEEKVANFQERWESFNELSAKTAQTAQVEQTNIQHLEKQIAFLQQRQEQLNNDSGQFNFTELNDDIEKSSLETHAISEEIKKLKAELEDVRNSISTKSKEQHEAVNALDKLRNEKQKLLGKQSSLEALQQTALGQRDQHVSPWIKSLNLEKAPRLGQNIKVKKGWEVAVEKVLGGTLQAICIEDLNQVLPYIDKFESGNVSVYTKKSSAADAASTSGARSLLEMVESKWSLSPLLSKIFIAEDLPEAVTICESLKEDESVVTKDGIWLSNSWLKVLRQDNPAAGIFQREEELKQLTTQLAEIESHQQNIEANIQAVKDSLRDLEAKRDQVQQTLNSHQEKSAQANAQFKMKQERLSQLKSQSERITKDQNACKTQLEQAQSVLIGTKDKWSAALAEQEAQTKNKEILLQQRDEAKKNLQVIRNDFDSKKQQAHELEIRLQTVKSQKQGLEQNITRMQSQIASLNDRKILLQSELASLPPMENLKKSLSRSLDKHVSVEVELNTARVGIESLEQESQNLDETRQMIEREINKVRSNLETLRVETQGWKVKTDTILEQIKETEFQLEDVLKDLPQDVSADEWQAKVDQVAQRIHRLGPINLVAIDEYAICLERKQYLDSQIEDLQSGLSTLDEAITKIDKETRAKFKETFDKVNTRFQELFPTIFGGGKAYLELTSENYLEAGVTMMACPPGKRNSSIYLLSGGEKSLTAIALIFSIFYLNPAPFCLLDEVDAPLDDANVLRYTRLVKSMAEKTQFIFISHNKLSIEMAENLIGVTMNEPGVSRLVSVDIEKAINLASTPAT